MRVRSLPMRLTASTLALATASAAWAAPPPLPPRIDPPGRVGRLARLSGSVSFHTADADRWSPASANCPLTTGDAVWTEPGARADIQLASNRIAMAPGTELDITTLDDHVLATSEPQGETYLNLRQVPPGDSYTVQTLRGLVQITAPGRYGVVAGDANHPTIVTVIDGAAQITGPNLALSIGPRQSATLTGAEPLQGSVGPMTQDAFLTSVLAQERPVARSTVPIPPVVAEMTGAEDLDQEGRWQETPQYGTIWYPPVEANWVPYRDGHWSYVAPWGWTWVDNAPWGFAPFHYGRWAQVDHRWGWIPVTPGAVGRAPVYAPALVSFLAVGAAGLAARSVGWVPLGPREPYYPPYRANLAYVRNLNASSVQNVSQTISTVTLGSARPAVNTFINRGAATIVPAAAMVASNPVAAASRALPPEQFAGTHAQFAAPIQPGPGTAGVTPGVARQFNFVPPARPASGPAIRPLPAVGTAPPEGGRQPGGHLAAPPPVAAARPVPAPHVRTPPPVIHPLPIVRPAAPPPVFHAPPAVRPQPPIHPAPPPHRAGPPQAMAAPHPPGPSPRPHPEEERRR